MSENDMIVIYMLSVIAIWNIFRYNLWILCTYNVIGNYVVLQVVVAIVSIINYILFPEIPIMLKIISIIAVLYIPLKSIYLILLEPKKADPNYRHLNLDDWITNIIILFMNVYILIKTLIIYLSL